MSINKPTPNQVYDGDIKWLIPNSILITMHGSHCYGLATPTSDVDVKGVTIPPKEFFFQYSKKFEQTITSKPYDMTIFEIKKFFSLAANTNPNVIEILFTDEEFHIHLDKFGKKLLDNRNLFITKRCKETFGGYAHGQLQRIKLHRRYLLNPPKKKPEREDFGLEKQSKIPKNQLDVAIEQVNRKIKNWDFDWQLLEDADRLALQNEIAKKFAELSLNEDQIWEKTANVLGFEDNFLEILKKERAYKQALEEWHKYQDWKTNRNEKRAELEAKYGYDTKHASHLVRLLRMAEEILTTGKVIVKRPDRDELLAIKNHGIWSYEQLVEWAENQDKKIHELHKACTILPKEPDSKKLNELCEEIIIEKLFSREP